MLKDKKGFFHIGISLLVLILIAIPIFYIFPAGAYIKTNGYIVENCPTMRNPSSDNLIYEDEDYIIHCLYDRNDKLKTHSVSKVMFSPLRLLIGNKCDAGFGYEGKGKVTITSDIKIIDKCDKAPIWKELSK